MGRSAYTDIEELEVDGVTVTDPGEMADHFNKFFVGAPPNLRNSIVPPPPITLYMINFFPLVKRLIFS